MDKIYAIAEIDVSGYETFGSVYYMGFFKTIEEAEKQFDQLDQIKENAFALVEITLGIGGKTKCLDFLTSSKEMYKEYNKEFFFKEEEEE